MTGQTTQLTKVYLLPAPEAGGTDGDDEEPVHTHTNRHRKKHTHRMHDKT